MAGIARGEEPVRVEWGPSLVDRANRFVRPRNGNHWLVGDCGEDAAPAGPRCEPAHRTHVNGMTVWQGQSGEHRLYRPGGGYLGQGAPLRAHLFLLPGGGWVTLEGAALPDGLLRSVRAYR